MNTIQKFFYRFTKEYKTKKAENWTRLWEYIEAKESQLRINQYKEEEEHNGNCPNCGSNKSIVDKIQRVHGKVSGRFSIIGGGHVSGSIDTSGINHCNSCGHQWKKYKWNTINENKAIRHINSNLCDSMEWEHYKYIQKELQPFYAENLQRLFVGWVEYSSIPTLSWLKENFKSIYDK